MTRPTVIVPPDPVPEWFTILNDNAMLSATEFARLLGCSLTTIQRHRNDGLPPWERMIDRRHACPMVSGRKGAMKLHDGIIRWRVRDIRKWIRDHKERRK